jgi:hypothetical protein
VLFGGQAKLLRALAETTLRLAQLHGQKSGAHEALVEAETGLARALGFVPRESPPPEPIIREHGRVWNCTRVASRTFTTDEVVAMLGEE